MRRLPYRGREWDADPYLLNCADGMLDLRTQTLGPHDPAALCTKITRWNYANTGSTGAWQRHLELCLPNATCVVRCSVTSAGHWWGLTSRRACRSGTARAPTARARPSAPCSAASASTARRRCAICSLPRKHERHPTEIADLAGARLVFSEEIEDGKHLDEALVKDLTGGSRKKARFMRCDNFEFEQTFTIFLSSTIAL